MRPISSCAAIGALLLGIGAAQAQLVNGDWENPLNTTGGTDTVADGWIMSDAVGATFTNPGQREAFGANGNNTPGGRWGFWLQGFTKFGNASQAVPGVVAGQQYLFSTDIFAEANYGNIPNMVTYLKVQYLNAGDNPVGGEFGSFYFGNQVIAGSFNNYNLASVAPAGATQALVTIGWDGNGAGGGGLSAFADSTRFDAVPEPATAGLLGALGMALTRRRRVA